MSQAARKLPPSPYREAPKAAEKKPSTQVTEEPPVPGFSAGTSRPEPPPPPERRTVLIAGSVAAVAAVVVAVLGYVAVSGGDGGDQRTSPPLTEIGSAESTVPTQPADVEGRGVAGEAVAVVEQGWYVDEDQVGSYGFVIENRTDQRLGPFVVEVTVYDEDGEVISGTVAWEHRVGTMQPRERLGMASQLEKADQADNGISKLDFTIADAEDSVGAPPDGEIVVSDIIGKDGQYSSRVTFSATSSYPVPLEGDAYVLVRDRAGRILGGASSFVDLPPFGMATGDFEFEPESVGGDVGGLEVYVVPSTAFRDVTPDGEVTPD